MKKKRPFVPVATPGTKGHPLLSRTGVPGWETGTTAVSQPGQINVFVVVSPPFRPYGPPLLPQSEPRKHIPQRSRLSPPPPRRLDRHHAAATSTPVSGAPAATPASSRRLGTPPPLCLHLEHLPQLQCLPCGPASHLPSRPPREAAAAAGNTHEKDQTRPHRWSSRLGREHIDNAHPHSIP